MRDRWFPSTSHTLTPTPIEVASQTQAATVSSMPRTNQRPSSGSTKNPAAAAQVRPTRTRPTSRASLPAGRSRSGRDSICSYFYVLRPSEVAARALILWRSRRRSRAGPSGGCRGIPTAGCRCRCRKADVEAEGEARLDEPARAATVIDCRDTLLVGWQRLGPSGITDQIDPPIPKLR